MLTAAAALALAAITLAQSPDKLAAAHAELRHRTGSRPYQSPIPPALMPQGDLSPIDDAGASWQTL